MLKWHEFTHKTLYHNSTRNFQVIQTDKAGKFESILFYSYSTIIAKIKKDKGGYYIEYNDDYYTTTTTRHQGYTHNACERFLTIAGVSFENGIKALVDGLKNHYYSPKYTW